MLLGRLFRAVLLRVRWSEKPTSGHYKQAYQGEALIIVTASYTRRTVSEPEKMPNLHWRVEFTSEVDDPKGLCEFTVTDGNIADTTGSRLFVRQCYYDHYTTISFSILKDTFSITGHLIADPDNSLLGPTYVIKTVNGAPYGFVFNEGDEPGPTDNP